MVGAARHYGYVHSTSEMPGARTRGALRPLEIAWIAIFGGLAVAAVVIGSVIPLAGAVRVLAPVPLALIGARTRPRAMVAASVSTAAVSFAMAGWKAALALIGAALVGGIVGEIKRRGHGWPTLLIVSIITAPVIGGVSVVVLLILKPLRELALTAMSNTLGGVAKWVGKIPSAHSLADGINGLRDNLVTYWWVWMWATGAAGTLITMVVGWWILSAVIDRLADIPSEDTLDDSDADDVDRRVEPLPLALEHVGFSYQPGGPQILSDIDLRIEPGEFIAVVGANGSGKSTLSKILAGRRPTTGVVHRPGAAGLGRRGGTAMVLQRPETQMLGARVADDVVWGLPEGTEVDVDALLAEVGLAGLAGRETSDLSGGQQQRLSIAAALARDPALLIADEVTSMVDPAGRAELLEVLRALPRTRGIAVVMITHRAIEAVAADRIVHLVEGRIVPYSPDWLAELHATDTAAGGGYALDASWHEASSGDVVSGPEPTSEPVLSLSGVGHTYLRGSPWEVSALHDVNLTVHRGEGLLIVGGNGSGKTTLAWIMAGLIKPTDGSCLLYLPERPGRGEPVSDHVGEVGLAFQHARLQLQKQNVGDDIMAVGGLKIGTVEVAHTLESVGLPRTMAIRRIDALSGGQMRRVVLAGLIARAPQVMILDEPLAGLDPVARDEVVGLLAKLRADGMTIVIISHDFASLGQLCTRRVRLAGGTLVPDTQPAGPAPADSHPANPYPDDVRPADDAIRRRTP
ncbi:putative ABC transporter ATP-binding protein [Gordonia aichiensis NBRC 108223]|uniref:Putative ABC transporter ATP-binding protein n=2 Tax=Gordonia aichiensis TaxID=36820 RepID=L7KQP5_9ACTN|nr:putative ABC transporter ATP-binding protein [Gordonia aichiensis NBRC 108223]